MSGASGATQLCDKANFDRDAANVWDSEAVLLIGIKDAKASGLNCGACGKRECIAPNTYEGEFSGPQCAFRILDIGIALGSAVKTASMLNVDNRIIYSVGVVSRDIGLIDADFVMGYLCRSRARTSILVVGISFMRPQWATR
jgi:uncharacterized ferredoxin-like protein